MDIPDTLINLEHAAEEARAGLAGLDGDAHADQWQRWWEAAKEFQAAVTAHAEATGDSRYEIEQAVKRAVRHPESAAA